MPKATRQSVVHPAANGAMRTAPAAIRGDAGSVLSEAIPVGDIGEAPVKMLLYGGNGVGKSTLACKFPKPLLLVSFEPGEAGTGGARSVKKMPGVEFLRMRPTLSPPDRLGKQTIVEHPRAKFIRLAHELKTRNPFRSVVVDSVTSFQDAVLAELLGIDELPAQLNFNTVSGDTYRDRAEQTKNALRPWLDLPCDTVFVAKEKDHNPPKEEKVGRTGKIQPDLRPKFVRGLQQESFVTADLGGGTASWLQDGCDYICRLYFDREMMNVAGQAVETGKFVRALRIGYHPNFAARFRSDAGEALPEEIIDPDYDRILAAIQGRPIG